MDFLGAVTYGYGTYDPAQGYSETDEMAGKFFEGPDGIIQLAIPAAAKGGEGNALRSPYVDATESYSVPGVGGFVQSADEGPDNLSGRAYTVGSCEAGPIGSTPARAPARTSTLRIRLLSKRASASRARRGRTLSLRLRSTEKITRLSGRDHVRLRQEPDRLRHRPAEADQRHGDAAGAPAPRHCDTARTGSISRGSSRRGGAGAARCT